MSGIAGCSATATPRRSGRRLSERRQVDTRQPAIRHARGGGARRRGRDARPQGDRRGLERGRVHPDRHRRGGLRGRARARGGDPPAGAHSARGRGSRGAGRRRARGAPPGRCRARARAARRRRARARGGQQGGRRAPVRSRERVLWARARRPVAGVRHPGTRHRRPARPDRGAPAGGRRGRRRRRDAAGADRAAERGQVVARQSPAGGGARDRDRRGGHDARLDRHPDRLRRVAR